ncbi:SAM-dependent methyltransferase [Mycolicibacterium setense]
MGVSVERTAIGPTMLVAIDQHDDRPIIIDRWAARILPPVWRVPIALARWGRVRRAMAAVSDKSAPGAWASLLCRKRYIDDLARTAARDGFEALVIVGAGYDTRTYRVPELADMRVWEVDLARNIVAKARALRRCFGEVPPHVNLVPANLEADNLTERLIDHGFDVGMRTVFVWESVTMYLTARAVRETLRQMAECAPGSRLAFTYFRKDFVDGSVMYGADAAYEKFVTKQKLWTFGLHPDDVSGLLAENGWGEIEQLGPVEYRDRHLKPAGRDQPVSEIERAVCAERLPATLPSGGGHDAA